MEGGDLELTDGLERPVLRGIEAFVDEALEGSCGAVFDDFLGMLHELKFPSFGVFGSDMLDTYKLETTNFQAQYE
jgi:hypothetical protein